MTTTAQPHDILDIRRTRCCVVGGGPGGVMLAYLLARQGIEVLLLEAHHDFDREFRGDTLHPGVLEILDSLGLADRLLQLPHTQLRKGGIQTPSGTIPLLDFTTLRTNFPYIALMPQVRFLDFMVAEARAFPSFHLILGANVTELIQESGVTRGVRYQGPEGRHEVRAELTVAADGRFSRIRSLAGLEPIRTSAPMDVLWFRLPRKETDSSETQAMFRVAGGRILIRLNRGDAWQMGYVIPKGGYHALRDRGIDAFQKTLAEMMPELADRVALLDDWKRISPLSVESNRLKTWSRPGLLLIGDAAHTMSPVGGVGIAYAIQDAVVASNLLANDLKSGAVALSVLREVQRRREWPTRVIQRVQVMIQNRFLGVALQSRSDFRIPLFMRLSWVRKALMRLIAFGARRVRVEMR